MRALVCYGFSPTFIPLGHYCLRALRSLGVEAHPFDSYDVGPTERYVFKPLNKLLSNLRVSRSEPVGRGSSLSFYPRMNRRFLEAVRELRPDLILVLEGKGFEPETLSEARRTSGARLVNWGLFGPTGIAESAERARHYDLFCTTSRVALAEHRRLGVEPSIYLPFAAEAESYKPRTLSAAERARFGCEVGFVGIWYAERQRLFEALTGFDLAIYGPRWGHKRIPSRRLLAHVRGEGLYGGDVVAFYQAAAVNVNVHAWHGVAPSGMNMRCFDVPACGGFLLTDAVEELGEVFTPGREVEVFADAEELADKVRYYLAHEDERRAIASRGREVVTAGHTYRHRMAELLEAVKGL
ncbi:glycosyltransferase [Nitrospinae bacterium AH_259_B05_G02_I21]|nr:glycosyltransferase [Nitrospinae bacterium AH_259_B05_G02_I21]